MPSLRLVLASLSRSSSSSSRRGSPGLSPDPLSLPSAISTAATSSHSRSRNHPLHHYPPTNLHAFSAPLVPHHHAPSSHRGGKLDFPSLPFSLPLLSLSFCILPPSFPPCYPRASHTLAHPLSLFLSLSRALGASLALPHVPEGCHLHPQPRTTALHATPDTNSGKSQCPGIFTI